MAFEFCLHQGIYKYFMGFSGFPLHYFIDYVCDATERRREEEGATCCHIDKG